MYYLPHKARKGVRSLGLHTQGMQGSQRVGKPIKCGLKLAYLGSEHGHDKTKYVEAYRMRNPEL